MGMDSLVRGSLPSTITDAWNGTQALKAPKKASGDQTAEPIVAKLNSAISIFKGAHWKNQDSCQQLDNEIKELTSLIKTRRNEIEKSGDPLSDKQFCEEVKARAEKIQTVVKFVSTHENPSTELQNLSKDIEKLIRGLNKEIDLDNQREKPIIAQFLSETIDSAYSYKTRGGKSLLEESLANITDYFIAGENHELRSYQHPDFVKQSDEKFFSRVHRSIELIEKGFHNRGEDVPLQLDGRLNDIEAMLIQLAPRLSHIRVLRNTISSAYRYPLFAEYLRSTSYTSGPVLERTKVMFHLVYNNDQLLRNIESANLEKLSDDDLTKATHDAIRLIKLGFKAVLEDRPFAPKKPIADLIQQLERSKPAQKQI